MNEECLLELVYRMSNIYAIHKFYSDDEERDDHGRWSGGGEGSEESEHGTIGGKAIGDVMKQWDESGQGKREAELIDQQEEIAKQQTQDYKDYKKARKGAKNYIEAGQHSDDYDKKKEATDAKMTAATKELDQIQKNHKQFVKDIRNNTRPSPPKR
jgi:hypothetical protein